eukprot:12829825-Heterocapsa_arctica.AAC.1
MVLFKEGDTEEEAISGLYRDLIETKDKLTSIGQVLDDKKEHIYVQSKRERESGTNSVQNTKAE